MDQPKRTLKPSTSARTYTDVTCDPTWNKQPLAIICAATYREADTNVANARSHALSNRHFHFFVEPVFAVAKDNLATAVSRINADVVFMRHALAPGFSDPSDFQLEKCATQRILGTVRRHQAVVIGAELRRSETFFTEVLSNEWCRCKETTELLNLQERTTFSGLNSFFQNFAEKEVVLQRLDQKLNELASGVTLMVTHQVVIKAVTGQSVGSAGLVAFNTRTKEVHKFRLD